MKNHTQPPWLRKTLTRNPALAFSGLYGFASVIGLIHSWAYLRPFGINVLQYSEISDFLLASLKEPLTWLLAALAFVLVQLDNAMSRRVEAKGASRWTHWYGTAGYRQINNPVAVIMIVLFLWILADFQHQNVRDGGGELFEVVLADGSPPAERVLLGTTVQFVFLYDRQSERVFIHPNENVLTLSPRPPRPATPSPPEPGKPESNAQDTGKQPESPTAPSDPPG